MRSLELGLECCQKNTKLKKRSEYLHSSHVSSILTRLLALSLCVKIVSNTRVFGKALHSAWTIYQFLCLGTFLEKRRVLIANIAFMKLMWDVNLD